MSISAIDIGTLVVSTPETCGGRPRIAGTRISLAQIAVWNKQGLSAEEILEEIPYLNLHKSMHPYLTITLTAMKLR